MRLGWISGRIQNECEMEVVGCKLLCFLILSSESLSSPLTSLMLSPQTAVTSPTSVRLVKTGCLDGEQRVFEQGSGGTQEGGTGKAGCVDSAVLTRVNHVISKPHNNIRQREAGVERSTAMTRTPTSFSHRKKRTCSEMSDLHQFMSDCPKA